MCARIVCPDVVDQGGHGLDQRQPRALVDRCAARMDGGDLSLHRLMAKVYASCRALGEGVDKRRQLREIDTLRRGRRRHSAQRPPDAGAGAHERKRRVERLSDAGSGATQQKRRARRGLRLLDKFVRDSPFRRQRSRLTGKRHARMGWGDGLRRRCRMARVDRVQQARQVWRMKHMHGRQRLGRQRRQTQTLQSRV